MYTIEDTGTASVSAGGSTVTGVGTSWVGKVFEGDLFTDPAQGIFARVTADATSDTSLSIKPWPGTDMSGDAYEILLWPDSVRSSERARQVLDELSVVQANGRGLFYGFSTTTADADPGAGVLRLNNATIGSATAAYADNLDANGADVSSVLTTWDDSGSITNRGQLWLRKIADPSVFHAFTVSGSVVDGTGYRKLTLAYIGGSGSFADGDELMVQFVPDGVDGTGLFSRVRAVAATNITIATALNDGDTLDGVTLATNDLVLVAGQTAPEENGVYVVGASPARDSSFDAYDDHPGVYISVMEGTTNADTLWRCTSDKGGTLDTAALVFTKAVGNATALGVIRVQSFTASGTYTPHAKMLYCIIEIVGGGGGGGGADGLVGGIFGGSGGGSGAYSMKYATRADIGASQTVTIGALGAGAAAGANTGSAGGQTSVGTLCTAPGGSGGSGNNGLSGSGGAVGTGTIALPGEAGGVEMGSGASIAFAALGGGGGSSRFGAGAKQAQTVESLAGYAGSGYGAGGGGAAVYNLDVNVAGGAGTAGFVLITEFCSE